jgi:hypothetical protein
LNFKESVVLNREANVEYEQDGQNAQDSKQVEGSGGDEAEVTSNVTSAHSMSFGGMTVGVRKYFYDAFGKLHYQY